MSRKSSKLSLLALLAPMIVSAGLSISAPSASADVFGDLSSAIKKASAQVAAASVAANANTANAAKPVLPTYYPGDARTRVPPGWPQYAMQQQMDAQARATYLGWALAQEGKYVDLAPGHHECADFVQRALLITGMMIPGNTSSPTGDYTWGRPVDPSREAILPGDIIQLVKVKLSYTSPTSWGTWYTGTQHTAIIIANNNMALTVIEQNVNGSPVKKGGVINLNWKLESGHWQIYRPYVRPMY